jgi:type VI secretion system protein ImpA
MAVIDILGLLEAVSSADPCGQDLEYDPAYGELERATQRKPEQQFGNTIVPAEEPDWANVQQLATNLLTRTKDLRVAIHLTRALARVAGWEGFRDGLALTRALLERYWEHLHPRIDPDDNQDPTTRVNTIITLCDAEATLDGLRLAPLVSSRPLGTYSLRDLQIANKELPPPKGHSTTPPEPQVIQAAFQEADLQSLQATADAIRDSLAHITSIEALLTERIGVDATPDLTALTHLVEQAQKAVTGPLAERTALTRNPNDSSALEPQEDMQDSPPAGTPLVSAPTGAICNRADVIRTLDLLCDYYRRQEPSSPIPLLLIRAKRLVSKNFLEILQDLAPDGLSQAKAIRGSESND